MKYLRKLILIICMLCLYIAVVASPNKYYGVDISYTHLNTSYYTVTVTGYVSCSANFSGLYIIAVTDGTTVKNYLLSNKSQTDITPVPAGQCDYCSNSNCGYGFGIYKRVATAVFNANDFKGCKLTISWNECCGDSATNVKTKGPYMFVECELNRCDKEHDSPQFLFDPVILAKQSQLTDKYQSVTLDNQADSVVYRLVKPQYAPGYEMVFDSVFYYLEPMTFYGSNSNPKRGEGFQLVQNTGELWFRPQRGESTFITIEADEYSTDGNGKKYLASSVQRLNEIKADYYNNRLAPLKIARADGNPGDTITACANVPLNFRITGSDPYHDTVLFMLTSVPAQFTVSGKSNLPVSYFDFSWTPTRNDIRKMPYPVMLTVRNRQTPVYDEIQRMFYIVIKDSMPVAGINIIDSGCGKYHFGLNKTLDTSWHLNYQWFCDTVIISNAASGSFTNTLAGTHQFSLIITNASGCSENFMGKPFSYDTAFNKLPAQVGICKGSSVQLSGFNANNLFWSPSAGLSSSTVYNPTASPLQSTLYTVSGKDANGCTWTDQVKVNVSDYKIQTIGDFAICPGSPAKLWADYYPGAIYAWSPDSLVSGAAYVDTTYAFPKQTTVFSVHINNSGCIKADSFTVYVNPAIINLGPDKSVCLGDSFSLEAPARKGSAYIWYEAIHNTVLDSGPNSKIRLKASVYKPSGLQFKVVEKDSIGCISTGLIKVNMISFNPSFTGRTKLCSGDSSVLNLSGGNKFQWAGGGISSDKAEVIVKPTASTTYNYSISDSLSGCKRLNSVVVMVYPKPGVVSGQVSVCTGDTAYLSAAGGDEYLWSPASLVNDPFAQNTYSRSSKSSTYFVTIKNNTAGCMAKDSVTVMVGDCIWPGDANRDNVADYLDVLNIGLGYGQTGPPRASGSFQWQKYQSKDWPKSLANGINFKHLDCNGDGIIDAKDTAVISANYGLKHNKWTPGNGNPNNPPVYFRFARDTFYAGDTAIAYLMAGSVSKSIIGAYGIGFQAGYAGKPIVQNTSEISNYCDFFCSGSELNYVHPLPGIKQFDATFVETSQVPVSKDRGRVAELSFILEDTLQFNYPVSGEKIYAHLLSALVIDSGGKEIPVYGYDDSAIVMKPKSNVGIRNVDNNKVHFKIYPNPAKDQIVIETRFDKGSRIILLNAMGEKLKDVRATGMKCVLNVADLSPGIYFIEVRNGDHIDIQKITIQK